MKYFALPADLEAEPGSTTVRVGGTELPQRVVHRPTGLSLTLVPPGVFSMGSEAGEGEADERPRHDVEIARPLYVGTTPVTRGQWARLGAGLAEQGIEGVTGFASGDVVEWHHDARASWRDPLRFLGFVPTDEHPVTQVAWHDAQQFCRRHGLRLPTEAEFEWAHRGGATTRYGWGDDPAGAAGRGNYCDRAMRAHYRHFRVEGRLLDLPSFDHDDGFAFTSPVGAFAANGFGLFDIGGNVWEWCEDVYDSRAYEPRQRDGHRAVGGEGPRRVLRGASWDNGPRGARCARRYSEAAHLRLGNVGFRVVRDLQIADSFGSAPVSAATDRLGGLIERARRVLTQDWAFGAVWATHHADGAYPHLAERAEGARFHDVNGREYLDWFVGGGVVTLGHRHPLVQQAMVEQLERGVHLSLQSPLEIEVAEQLCALFPAAEQVAFGKNGTDVTSAAVRLARAVTGREHVLVSGYHGWQDWAKAASAAVTGIPTRLRELVHEFGYNDLDGARALLARLGPHTAAIVVEPVRYDLTAPGYLAGLRELADAHGCLLVFDEIVTGLRVARGGAQGLAGVAPDLTCLAKSLANGLPLAALLGKRRWMKHLPGTFFALTYQREALSLAAARAALQVFASSDVTGHLARIGTSLQAAFAAAAARHGLPWAMRGHPSMLHLHVEPVGRLTARGAMALFVECVQREGIYLQPFRVLPSLAHTEADVAVTAAAIDRAMGEVRRAAEHGLAGRLDSPVWGDFENVAPPPPSPLAVRTRVVAGSWLVAPKGIVEAGALVASAAAWEPAGLGAGLLLPSMALPAAGSARCELQLLAPCTGDLRIAARCRFRAWQPGNAVVTVALAVEGLAGRFWFEVVHQSSFGQTPKFRASLAGQTDTVAGTYGEPEFTLRLERHAGNWLAAAGVDGEDEMLRGPGEMGPVRIWLQVRTTGARSGPVALELCELSIGGPA